MELFLDDESDYDEEEELRNIQDEVMFVRFGVDLEDIILSLESSLDYPRYIQSAEQLNDFIKMYDMFLALYYNQSGL